MKIPQEQTFYKKNIKIFYVISFISFFLIVAGVLYEKISLTLGGGEKIKHSLQSAKVGTFINDITAFGELKSTYRRNIVAQVAGTITEIYVRPGAKVESETVIFLLKNPQLEKEYESIKLELDEVKSSLEQLKAELTDQELVLKNDVLITRAELNTQFTELEAKEILAKKLIISELELKRERVLLEQARLKSRMAEQRYKTFQQTKVSKIDVAMLRVKGVETRLNIKLSDIEALKIKAGMNGVLQSVDDTVELGQRLEQGSNIGVVADLDSLYAEIRVSASDAARVVNGMIVNMDIKGKTATGIISRVAPSVIRNQVQVDVEITSVLPITARPDVEIRASVILASKNNVILLPRPPHFKDGVPLELYVKNKSGFFELKDIEVGLVSNDLIEVVNGVSAGQELLLIDPKDFDRRKVINL